MKNALIAIAVIAAATFSSTALAGPTAHKYAVLDSVGKMDAVKPTEEIATYCTACNTISVTSGEKLGEEMTCPACGKKFHRVQVQGGKKAVAYKADDNATLVVAIAE